ncbi:hypothetical protein H9Q72_007174 [Fusarium xylarioides]|uniref:Apple domain-containing protein n=1 Tax=Fusarium xylarioides TaxID=221167 RepID=A0A9P7HW95_9HYPO|nr:hypothetical protein H9Q72_007174 [Fusarium xylarioides]
MGGSYTSSVNDAQFTTYCKSTPNAAVPLSFIRTLSFDECLDACAAQVLCAAAVYNSGFSDCNLYSSVAGGVRSNPAYDLAVKDAPAQVTTTSEEPTTSVEATTTEEATTSAEATTSEVATTSEEVTTSEASSSAESTSTEATSTLEPTVIPTTTDVSLTATTSVETSTEAPATSEAFSSTSQASTETDDCDDETTTQPASTSAHALTTTSESSSIETQSESTVESVSSATSSLSTAITEPAASTSESSSSASQSESASSRTTDVGSKTTSAGQSTAAETTKTVETTKATETTETSKNQVSTSLTTSIPIPVYSKPVSYTKVIPTETVTTVTFVTVCPTNPASLTTTYVPVTITYEPCGCDHQTYPPVQMTATTISCHACGSHGENTVTLTIPAAACETPSGSHGYATGHGNAQPTEESHSYMQPGHEIGHSSVPSHTQGKPQPGHENGKPYVSVHGSPEPTHNNGTYHPPAQPTVPASHSSIVVLPSASAPNKGQEAAPTTLATEADVTGERQTAKSTQGVYPSQPAEAPSTSVIASGANKRHLMVWTWVAGVIGLAMAF